MTGFRGENRSPKKEFGVGREWSVVFWRGCHFSYIGPDTTQPVGRRESPENFFSRAPK